MIKNIIVADSLSFNDILSYPKIEIPSGATTFICGESGCGKSTLLKMLNNTVIPSSGKIFFNGEDILSYDSLALRRRVLLVSQGVFLFDKTIKENFECFYSYLDLPSPQEKDMKRFLKMCGADFSLDTMCSSMSGGERQRVYLAIFVSLSPNVLMLDEPTSALDGDMAMKVIRNIKDFCTDCSITLVVISHDKQIVNTFADEIISLSKKEATPCKE